MNNPNVLGFNDEFFRLQVEENMPKGGNIPPEELTKDLEIQIDNALKSGKTVIFKVSGDFSLWIFEDTIQVE